MTGRLHIRPIPRKAIRREIERLAKPPAPAHMPRLVERGVWHRLPFFVMERIEPIDYPIPAKTYRAFCVAAFEALAALYAADLIHGDITPRHLGWKNGRIAFIDFDNSFTHDGAAINTGLYFYRRAATERKYGKWIEANVHLRSGLIFLQRGDPANAIRHLRQSERNGSEEARANLKEIGASD